MSAGDFAYRWALRAVEWAERTIERRQARGRDRTVVLLPIEPGSPERPVWATVIAPTGERMRLPVSMWSHSATDGVTLYATDGTGRRHFPDAVAQPQRKSSR